MGRRETKLDYRLRIAAGALFFVTAILLIFQQFLLASYTGAAIFLFCAYGIYRDCSDNNSPNGSGSTI